MSGMLKFGHFRKDNVARSFGIYILYNCISVIPEGRKIKHEGLHVMKRHLGMTRISLSAGFEPTT